MVRLRSAGLSKGYRQSLRDAGSWLLDVVTELGMTLKSTDHPHKIDACLERAVELAYKRGERFYRVNLGVVALQRAFHLSAPLLRGTWGAVRGWRALQPVKSRIPLTRYRLECMILVALSRGWQNVVGFVDDG